MDTVIIYWVLVFLVFIYFNWRVNVKKSQQDLLDSLNLLRDELEKILFVTLEPVKQDHHDLVYLVFDYKTRKFLCQGLTETECENTLKNMFPDRKIMVVTDEPTETTV